MKHFTNIVLSIFILILLGPVDLFSQVEHPDYFKIYSEDNLKRGNPPVEGSSFNPLLVNPPDYMF